MTKYGDPYSEFNPSKVHTHREHTPRAVDSHLCCGTGEQLGVRGLAQGSQLSRGIEGEESAGHSLPPTDNPCCYQDLVLLTTFRLRVQLSNH